jgi:hypothetical protein
MVLRHPPPSPLPLPSPALSGDVCVCGRFASLYAGYYTCATIALADALVSGGSSGSLPLSANNTFVYTFNHRLSFPTSTTNSANSKSTTDSANANARSNTALTAPDPNPSFLGASHWMELPFVFFRPCFIECGDGAPPVPSGAFTADEQRLSLMMMAQWSYFLYNGRLR